MNFKEIDQLKDLILTHEQYKNLPWVKVLYVDKNKERSPYVFEVSRGEKSLLYFGVWHTNDPANPQFADIEARFKLAKPDIVYIEGWETINTKSKKVIEEIRNESLEEVKTQGESNFTLKLAIDAGVDFESPEPKFLQ